MEEYILYFAYAIIVLGIIRIIRAHYIVKKNNVVEGITVKVRHTSSKNGRKYSYPKVEVDLDGISRVVNCSSIKKSSYDKVVGCNIDQYSIGDKIPLYQYRNLLQKETFRPVHKFFLYSFKTLSLGIILFISIIFLN